MELGRTLTTRATSEVSSIPLLPLCERQSQKSDDYLFSPPPPLSLSALANQTRDGQPEANLHNGLDASADYALSYLPGQRLSRCTCPDDETHPGPSACLSLRFNFCLPLCETQL